ncbi:CTD small phosphatase-like protein 3 [Trichinella spiralis]|uniref:Mitochondrial import inner membrane translocase subunit TIM50 n=1 Tax=Trichinella spiralis TaxID=6334 RepID=A0A0V1APA3_TRISP|nr:CTD small phosphatase-like protein 3 [Trichinella spiralis]
MSENYSEDKREENKPDKEPCVKSVSSSAEIPKLTVVFDLHKLLPAQSRLPLLEAYTAIRPYCDTMLKKIRKYCTIMIFSSGTEQSVNDVHGLIDPKGEYFEKVFIRNNCTKVINLYGKYLAKTGADLKRTVLIDDRLHSFMHQPFNGIPIRPWTGHEDGTELLNIKKLIMDLIEEKDVCALLKQR